MIAHLSHVMTLANSIIGVSVLAMPFCFKQCGIILAILVLLMSSLLSRLACHFLIKSAVMSRRRNFEFLAFHAFGTTGKFFVELFIIGFLLGTCVAFFVVVGDLGPQIIGKMLNKRPEDIRTSVLATMGIFIVLPLGLLRNIDSLSSVCTATIGFYFCLVLKVICESTRHILLGDWYDSVMYWRPAGILQCLPIFSMALFCQTQLFEIYEAIPNVCLEKMNQVVRGALNICTAVYLCVGFFGYVAFCSQPFTGNILMSFEPSLTSDVIKMGFVFSVAFSFPLVIFPCRASLDSLLFRRAHSHEQTINYIPEVRFRWLTLAIVSVSLGTGILIPNIEFILGIVGSTIGVMICLIFPAAFFIAISTKNTNERLVAQAILFFGLWIMVLGTYANIYAMEDSSNARIFITTGKPVIEQLPNDIIPFEKLLEEDFPKEKKTSKLDRNKEKAHTARDKVDELPKVSNVVRDPPIHVDRSSITEKPAIDTKNLVSQGNQGEIQISTDEKNRVKEQMKIDESKKLPEADQSLIFSQQVTKRKVSNTAGGNLSKIVKPEKNNENLIDSDAIKKEESELAAAAGDVVDLEAEARHEKLRQTLEKHKLEQLEMMQEQKELLRDLEEKKQEFELEKKRLASERDKSDNTKERKFADESKIIANEKVSSNVEKFSANIEEPRKNGMNDQQSLSTKINDQRESRGPVLNALTNWTLSKNLDKDNNVESEPRGNNETQINPNDIETMKKSVEIALPIALRLSSDKINKSGSTTEDKIISSVRNHTSIDEKLAIRRDILQHRDTSGKREKRANDNFTNETNVDTSGETKIEKKKHKLTNVNEKSCDTRGSYDNLDNSLSSKDVKVKEKIDTDVTKFEIAETKIRNHNFKNESNFDASPNDIELVSNSSHLKTRRSKMPQDET